jgi:hypothetical protein
MKRRFFRATETEQQKQKQTNYRLSTVSTFLLHKKSKDVKLIAYGCIISSTMLLQLWLLYDNFLNVGICSSAFSYCFNKRNIPRLVCTYIHTYVDDGDHGWLRRDSAGAAAK